MNLKEIVTVSGHGGLFKFVSQSRNGIIVESFNDGKRSFVSTSTKVSYLEGISVFTGGEEIPLVQVFRRIYENENGNPAPDPKSPPEQLKSYMEKLVPDYDRDRVYVSDIKKILSWYNILHANRLLDFSQDGSPEAEREPENDAKAEAKPEGEAGN